MMKINKIELNKTNFGYFDNGVLNQLIRGSVKKLSDALQVLGDVSIIVVFTTHQDYRKKDLNRYTKRLNAICESSGYKVVFPIANAKYKVEEESFIHYDSWWAGIMKI